MSVRIALIGLPGAGKSAVAPILAARLGVGPVDLDALVERRTGAGAAEWIRSRGEAAFRTLESEALREALAATEWILACGGGAVERAENRALLKARAFVAWLRVEPADAAERLGAEGVALRPLLAGSDPIASLRALLLRRGEAYADASVVRIETSGRDPSGVAAEVERAWRAAGGRWDSSGS